MSGRFILPTPEEEREIAEGIAADPDAAPDMSEHRGDIVPRHDLSFAGGQSGVLGPDWQERINSALRTAAKL